MRTGHAVVCGIHVFLYPLSFVCGVIEHDIAETEHAPILLKRRYTTSQGVPITAKVWIKAVLVAKTVGRI